MGNSFAVGAILPARKFNKEGLLEVDAVVRTVQVYASFLITVNMILCWIGIFLSLVPGASLGGDPVGFRALPHIIFFVPNIAALWFATFALYFDSDVSVARTVSSLLLAFIFMIFSVAINVVHGLALWLEFGAGSSIFYNQGFGFLLALAIAVTVFVAWQLWLAARLWVFRNTLMNAVAGGWQPGTMRQYSAVPGTSETPDVEEGFTPTAPVTAAIKSRNRAVFSAAGRVIGAKTE